MRFSLHVALRSLAGRRRRLMILALMVALGMVGLVSVRAIAEDIRVQIGLQARTLLGADLELAMPGDLSAAQTRALDQASEQGAATQRVVILPTLAAYGAEQALVQVKAVKPELYPYYGQLQLQPDGELADLITGPEEAVVALSLANRLGLTVGDRITLGDRQVTIRGILTADPTAAAGSALAGPTVLVHLNLMGEIPAGAQDLLLVRLPEGQAAAELERDLTDAFGPTAIRRYDEVAGAVQQSTQTVLTALAMVAFISLLLGALGINSSVRAFVAESTQEAAVLRALGASPSQVLLSFTGQILAAGGAGSLLGVAGGTLLHLLANQFLSPLLPVTLSGMPSLAVLLNGFGIGVGVSLFSALPSLTTLLQVRPGTLLRPSNADQRRLGWLPVITTAAGVSFFLLAAGGSVGAPFLLLVGLVTLLLYFLGRALVWVLRQIPGGWLPWYLARRSLRRATVPITVTALSVGTFFMAGLGLLQAGLLTDLRGVGGGPVPNLYLVQVPVADRAAILSELSQRDEVDFVLPSFALVNANVQTADGSAWSTMVMEADGQTTEEVVRGRWFSPEDTGHQRAVLREAQASAWGVEPGDLLTVTVHGKPLTVEVIGLWRPAQSGGQVRIDAPLILAAGGLGEHATTYVIPVRAKAEAVDRLQRWLVTQFPGVLPLSLGEVLTAVESVINTLADLLRYVILLALITGAAAVAGGVASAQLEKRRDGALLQTLGLFRHQVQRIQLLENFVMGLAAGLAGSLLANLTLGVGLALLTGEGPEARLILQTMLLWPCIGGLLAGLSGQLALSGGAKEPPLRTLRAG